MSIPPQLLFCRKISMTPADVLLARRNLDSPNDANRQDPLGAALHTRNDAAGDAFALENCRQSKSMSGVDDSLRGKMCWVYKSAGTRANPSGDGDAKPPVF